MTEILKYGEQGGISWIENLINDIIENPKEFISIAKVNDGNKYYTFIVLFKNKCEIGKYIALILEWAANDGLTGGGGKSFIRMNEFLSNENIKTLNLELDMKDAKKIGPIGTGSIKKWKKRKDVWKPYVDQLILKIS